MLVTIDVVCLYTNISRDLGLEIVRQKLKTRKNKEVPTDFLIKLLELLLKFNIFEFDEKFFNQLLGTSMGTKAAPNYADIVMAYMDKKILEAAAKFGDGVFPVMFFKRFLDDLKFIFLNNHKRLHEFLAEINKIHPSFRFTMTHTKSPGAEDTCDCPDAASIPFLDLSISIKNKKISTDLYRKPSDKVQYLLPSSCHPNHCHQNIPYSLALRIVRICSEEEEREVRFTELKEMLLSRDYKPGLVNSAINRARAIPRSEALKRVKKPETAYVPVFCVQYDRRMPSMNKIIQKHYRTMITVDSALKETFPKPFLVAYRRPANLREKLIRAKLPKPLSSRPKRSKKGMKKCHKKSDFAECPSCPFVNETKVVKSTANNFSVEINTEVDCQTKGIIYCITCKKCSVQYIGTSKKSLQDRFANHRGYVNNKDFSQPTGRHFNSRGHSISDMSVVIVEKVYKFEDRLLREERESHYIREFNSRVKGLNIVS